MGKISNFFKKFKANKNFELIVAIVLCIIIVILFLSTFLKTDSTEGSSKNNTDDLISYNQLLEKKLCELILSLDGIKKVNVAITYSSGTKTVYAYETTVVTSGGTQTEKTEIVYVDGKPLVVQEIAPEVLGVAIVATGFGGTNSAVLRLQITEMVVKLLNIDSNKIQIITYSN